MASVCMLFKKQLDLVSYIQRL